MTGDHGTYQTVFDMIDGKVKGYFLLGQNPAVGSAHGRAQRLGMANLDWLVVRDLFLIESATFWKNSPEVETGEIVPERCRTEVFFLPAASHVEKEGTFTQTQRLLQWREKAVEPPGDARSELWFFYHLGRRHPGEAGRLDRRRATGPCSTWPGTIRRTVRTPSRAPRRCCGRSTGTRSPPAGRWPVHRAEGRRLDRRRLLDLHRGASPTASTRPPGASPARSRTGSPPSGAGPGRRTGASSTTAPPPTRRAGRGASARRTSGGTRSTGEWTGHDVPDFEKTKPPSYRPPSGASGVGRARRRRPVHHAGRREGLAVRAGRRCWTARCRPTTSRPSRRCATRSTDSRPTRPARSTAGRTTRSTRARRSRTATVFPYVVHRQPAHRAPHRRRDEPDRALPGGAAAGDVRARCRRSWRPSAG